MENDVGEAVSGAAMKVHSAVGLFIWLWKAF